MNNQPNPTSKDNQSPHLASAWRPNTVTAGVAASLAIAVMLLVALQLTPDPGPHQLARTGLCAISTASPDRTGAAPAGSPTVNGLTCIDRPWSAGSDPTVAP